MEPSGWHQSRQSRWMSPLPPRVHLGITFQAEGAAWVLVVASQETGFMPSRIMRQPVAAQGLERVVGAERGEAGKPPSRRVYPRAELHLTLCSPVDCPPDSCPWGFPSKNTGVSRHFLLPGNYLTRGSKPHLRSLVAGTGGFFTTKPPGKLTEQHSYMIYICCLLIQFSLHETVFW